MFAQIAHPESIVETDWVAGHLGDQSIAFVEVDVDTSSYRAGPYSGCHRLELDDPAKRHLAS
jgi:uncharacterized ParB-like nuclease family protein